MNIVSAWLSKLVVLSGVVVLIVAGIGGSHGKDLKFLEYGRDRYYVAETNMWPLLAAGALILAAGVALEITSRARRTASAASPSSPPSAS